MNSNGKLIYIEFANVNAMCFDIYEYRNTGNRHVIYTIQLIK